MALAEHAAAEAIGVEVAYCPRPGVTDLVWLQLPASATVEDALRVSGVLERHGLTLQSAVVGIWSRVRELDAALRDGDRVELYRSLLVDPKEARRLRYKGARKKAAG